MKVDYFNEEIIVRINNANKASETYVDKLQITKVFAKYLTLLFEL